MQPLIVALMTDLLDTSADNAILGTGTGFGYEAVM
jgi:protein-L-isoaspartate O-methyltransferase